MNNRYRTRAPRGKATPLHYDRNHLIKVERAAERRKRSPYSSPDFKKLNTQWYAKLRASGFSDIEHNESSPFIKDHWMSMSDRVRRGWRTGAEALMAAADDYLHTASGSRRSERVNVALYLKGMSVEEIAERFSESTYAVKKQIMSYMERVRQHVQANTYEQAKAGGEAEGSAEEGEQSIDLSDADPDPGTADPE